MKRFGLFICLICMNLMGSAQKISDSYFEARNKYWTGSFKEYTEKRLLTASDTTLKKALYNSINNRAENERLFIKTLFNKYQYHKQVDLDTSGVLYLLEKKQMGGGEYIIWNKQDTLFTGINSTSISNESDFSKIEIYNFNNSKNKQRNYILSIMNMVSLTDKNALAAKIEASTSPLNKDGSLRIVADGYSFKLYIFTRKNATYDVKNYSFRNPRVND